MRVHRFFWLYAAVSNLVTTVSFTISQNASPRRMQSRQPLSTCLQMAAQDEEVDVVVVGAGVGGLSAAALTSKYGLKTICVESHDTAGGVARSFARYSSASKDIPFQFDSGPSLITGLSKMSTNPLRQVLDAIGTADAIDWKRYDGWVVHDYADGKSFKLTTGDGGEFERALEEKEGKEARVAYETFKEKMLAPRGISEISAYLPPFAIRGDLNVARTLLKYAGKLLQINTQGLLLNGPFSTLMDMYGLEHPFIRKWFDYLAFALSGLDAAHTQAAPVAYMMTDLHQPGAVLDYPMGGMDSLIQALVKGMSDNGGELRVNSRVEEFMLESHGNKAECKGVVMSDGSIIRARKGVISNVPLWNMAKILEDSIDSASSIPEVSSAVEEIRQQANQMNMTKSFMHLHLGIPKEGLPDDIECHHSVLDFSKDIDDEQNMVIISIPTLFDPSLAPPGYHVVHAYTAAADSFDQWLPFLEEGSDDTGKVGCSPNSMDASKYNRQEAYKALKEEKAEVLWRAIECVIPDVRDRAQQKGSVVLVGTPLTHRRYNQRFRGTYGPAPNAGKDVWELPGASTAIDGLLACGDTTFPGIGLPGVAASGTIAANTLTSVKQQTTLMKELRSKGALQ